MARRCPTALGSTTAGRRSSPRASWCWRWAGSTSSGWRTRPAASGRGAGPTSSAAGSRSARRCISTSRSALRSGCSTRPPALGSSTAITMPRMSRPSKAAGRGRTHAPPSPRRSVRPSSLPPAPDFVAAVRLSRDTTHTVQWLSCACGYLLQICRNISSVWAGYDDAASSEAKFAAVKAAGWRGVGFWQASGM